MITDSETNTVFVSALLRNKYPRVFETLEGVLKQVEIPLLELQNTADVWCRDYMLVQISGDTFIRFVFNPSYLKYKKYEHLLTDTSKVPVSFSSLFVPSGIVLDGGNVVCSGTKAVVTDFIFKDNLKPKAELVQELRSTLKVEELIVVPHVPYDFTGHSDGMVRFVNEDTILVNDFRPAGEKFFLKLEKVLQSHNLKIHYLPWYASENSDYKSDCGDYLNFLHVGNLIVMPQYHMKSRDDKAREVIAALYPNAKIECIDCTELAAEGGVLRCCTWNIKLKNTPYAL